MKFLKFLALSVLVVAVIIGLADASKLTNAQSLKWGYGGTVGPGNWADLSPEFVTCKIGKKQSPINLENGTDANLPAIEFAYKNTPFTITNRGYDLQINYEPGSYAIIGNKKYELLQFHFHSPSEHTLNGNAYPMEAHLVHQSEDGEYAVVGVLALQGKKNDFIEALWSNIPESGAKKTVSGIEINASALLPEDKSYYHYTGSFTTPPCTEGVNWNVFETPIEVSTQQIVDYYALYQGNARPVQALNNRMLKHN